MNGKKIAKSDGNVAYMDEVIHRGFLGEDLRYYFLQAHYRSFQDFTREWLEAASKARKRMKSDLCIVKRNTDAFVDKTNGSYVFLSDLWKKIASYLADDFDTPKALATFHEAKGEWSSDEIADIAYLDTYILKLGLFDEEATLAIPQDIQALAERRRQAKLAKDWLLADQLRTELTDAWWTMQDGKDDYEVQKM